MHNGLRFKGGERHPEFDAISIFREIIARHLTDFTRGLPAEKIEQLPRLLAETHRAASRLQLQLYPGVEHIIRQLHQKYQLAIISDGQTAYAVPELNAVGLTSYFDPIIISGDIGYELFTLVDCNTVWCRSKNRPGCISHISPCAFVEAR